MNRSVRRLTYVGAVLVAGALVVGAAAASGESKVIARGLRLKGSDIWYVQGKAFKPNSLSASVAPVTAQSVEVQWSVVCEKPNPADPAIQLATGSRSGESSLRAPATLELALPYRRPPRCVATVYVTPSAKGMLTLRLLQS